MISGCIVKSSESKESSERVQNDYLGRITDGTYAVGDVYFYHDDDKQVSCWITRMRGDGSLHGGGISCIPDKQIDRII